LYVGKAKNLKRRISSYFLKHENLGLKTKSLLSKLSKIETIQTDSEIEALLLEAKYIKKFSPRYNSRLTDGKSYPLIKITVEDIYPKVLITRRTEDSSSLYFGPYPNAKAMRLVLRTLRKLFPFQSVINHPPKLCFYNHLGLCPCPYINDSLNLRKEYQRNIRHIIDFLNGKIKKIIKDLEKERNKLSDNLQFEKAKNIQEKIDSIITLTTPATRLFETNIDPNLEDDKISKSVNLLLGELKKLNVLVKDLKRIECYDVSNISGKFAVASMVVFKNGEKDLSSYRRFKIKFDEGKPNDFAMLKEAISRRFTHKKWQKPSLIVLDGGKGQVSVISKLFKFLKIDIPLIGLAKKEETIVLQNLKEINLRKDSPALYLLMRIRDEAHRFALSYHRKLYLKNLVQ